MRRADRDRHRRDCSRLLARLQVTGLVEWDSNLTEIESSRGVKKIPGRLQVNPGEWRAADLVQEKITHASSRRIPLATVQARNLILAPWPISLGMAQCIHSSASSHWLIPISHMSHPSPTGETPKRALAVLDGGFAWSSVF